MRAGLVALTLAAGTAQATGLEHISTFIWERPEKTFGGWSGIEVAEGGATFVAIGDKGQVFEGRLVREDDAITAVEKVSSGPLMDETGAALTNHPVPEMTDAEGMARLPDGRIAVSFEQFPRVLVHGAGTVQRIALPREAEGLHHNGGTEALAVDAEGRLIAIPETIPRGAPGFPVWWQTGAGWEVLFYMPKTQGFAPVGADFGPDGRLYVLERAFRGAGFQNRIRRIDLSAPGEGEVIWTPPMLAFDNLEGISVWKDHAGETRVTLVSDDNFNWFQRTEIVEFRLTE